MVGRAEIKTTMEGGAGLQVLTEDTQKEGGSEDNMDSGPMTSNGRREGE